MPCLPRDLLVMYIITAFMYTVSIRQITTLQLLDRRDRPGVVELSVDARVLQTIVILDRHVQLTHAVMTVVINEPLHRVVAPQQAEEGQKGSQLLFPLPGSDRCAC